MSALINPCPRDRETSNDSDSAVDRMRVRMTRLMHLGRDRRPVVPVRTGAGLRESGEPGHRAVHDRQHIDALTAEVSTLMRVIEDSEDLIRQAWCVAGDLNCVRRECRCQAPGLSEAIGRFQGLLNRCRHNLRTATAAIDNLRSQLLVE